MRRLGGMAIVAVGLTLGGAAQAQRDVYELRAGAWDRSVELERRGDVAGARNLLVEAWGTESDSYEVTVRLAYLESRLGHTDAAVALYRRAAAMPHEDADASRGLASALTVEGFSRLDDGDRAGARARFNEAIAADSQARDAQQGLDILGSESRVDPEVWVAYLNQTVEPDRFQGWAVFAHVPWRMSDHVRLRLAGRYLETYGESYTAPSAPMTGPGRGRQGSSSQRSTDRQGELYGSLEWSGRYVAIEGMGFGLIRKGEGVVPGEAAALRLGGRFGFSAQQAALFRDAGVGWQVMPQVYAWPTRTFGAAAGARYTKDPRGGEVAGVAGLSLVGESAALYLQGHIGTERWPVAIETPSVLALDADLTAGVTATTTFRLGESVQLGLQGQWEKVEVPSFDGSYYSISTGLIWSP